MRRLSTLLLISAMTAWGEDARYGPHEALGTPPADVTPEISGMAVSSNDEDVVWVHNDSGDGPFVYALALSTGEILGVAEMPDIAPKDCEDIAIGPGPTKGLDYLYLADIGNNQREKNRFWIYRIPEPDMGSFSDATPPKVSAQHVETLIFSYPDPEVTVFDAETLLVDPESGEITVVTKDHNENNGLSFVFRTNGPPSANELNQLTQVGTMFFDEGVRNRVTGGDVSRDGRWVIVRTYLEARLYRRVPGQNVAQALLGPYTTIALAWEPQGEAIAFGRSRKSESSDLPIFYTVSELGTKRANPKQMMRPITRYRPLPTEKTP